MQSLGNSPPFNLLMPMDPGPETSSVTDSQSLTIRRALAVAIVKGRREAEAAIKVWSLPVCTNFRTAGIGVLKYTF